MDYELYHSAKGSQKTNHKYIDRQWVGSKWVYIYPNKVKGRPRPANKLGISPKVDNANRNAAYVKRGAERFRAGIVADKLNNFNKKYSGLQKALGVDKRDNLKKKQSAYNAAVKAEKGVSNADKNTRQAAKKNVTSAKVLYDAAVREYGKTPLGKLDAAKGRVADAISKGKKKISFVLRKNKIKRKIKSTSNAERSAREKAIAAGKKRQQIKQYSDSQKKAQRMAVQSGKNQQASKKNNALHKIYSTSEANRADKERAVALGKSTYETVQRQNAIKNKIKNTSEENRRYYENAQRRARAARKY